MIKHSKIRTTKTNKQIERNKSISHNSFKSSLFILACSVLFFSILIIGFILFKGSLSVGKIWSDGDWILGNKYDGVILFASGFMVVNTLWTSLLAALLAVPISVLTALFVTRVAPKSLRPLFFVVLSILAAIPSVIYGAFGSKVIDTIIMFIFGISSGTLLTIVVTLSFMIMPTITLITTTSINTIDKRIESSSLALGATRNQTSFHITIRAAATGILTATILGVGRAIGEATAISMISVDPYTGPTFGLFEQIRLLTATMLKGYNELEPGSKQEASMFSMGMLLILTILTVFLSMRYLQKKNTPETKSKVASKKIISINKIQKEAKNKGIENMSISKQKRFNKLLEKQSINSELDKYYHNQYNKQMIIKNTTVKTTNEKVKKQKSNMLGGLTWFTAIIGMIFLVSIILFLLILGTNELSWSYISNPGENGMQSAIFGTLLLIGLSMLMIIPLGVGTGVYFSTFAKDTRITKILLTGIDILTGIPSLVFGLVGAAVFLPLSTKIGFAPLSGAIILTLIVVPTVVQTTKEAITSIPKQTINGSLALGSTKTTSSLRLALPASMPQIIAGIVLATGRILGESAAIVMVFGTVSRGSASEWTQLGGTTLATEMYRLTLLEEIPWDQVAAIGLVILSLILLLSLLSNYISNKDTIGIFGMLVSITIILTGIFVGEHMGFIIFVLGIILFLMTIITTTLLKRIWGKR